MKNTEPKLALLMIVKATDDEAPHLARCLESVAGHVDDIFLNLNRNSGSDVSKKVRDVAAKYGAHIYETVWQRDFSQARNYVLDKVPEDFTHILWLDSDDTVDKPEKMKKVCEASIGYDAIYVDYIYDRDEEGNPQTVHMVARIFKNNGGHRWKGRIHETLIETRAVSQGATKDFNVLHHADGKRQIKSQERNIELMEAQIKEEEKDPDPRTFYYLGSAYIDVGATDQAKQLLSDYLQLSGWDQERSAAYTKLGRLFLEEGNRAEAKKQFMLAIGEDPDNPEPRVEMGSLELEMKAYNKARKWLEGVESMEKDMTTLERNPLSYTFRTYLLLVDVYMGLGGKYIDKAVEYGKKALKYKKKNKQIREYVRIVEAVANDKKLTEDFINVFGALRKNKETDKMKRILDCVPKQLDDNPVFVKLRNKNGPYKWPEKSICIMTGDTAIDSWGPWSLKDGIGGSEEAIIRLAPKLAKLGYKVVVYAKPENNAGLIDGVMWRNFWEINLEDEFDIFIAWRAPFIFENEIKARKSYLWLHDVMEPGEFTPNRIKNFTKCIVLSKYHRSLFPMIPDEKILLSGNGIDPEEFVEIEQKGNKRDPHKMVYASSHVRGLAYLYEIWPDIKKAIPDATLDVYYGRESYDAVHKGNPERMKWMDDMMAKAKSLKGVTDHGKVSQSKIIEESFSAGVWPYPCPFPEIYCITAVKSQAAGAVPVASNYAALDETIQFGYKQEFKEFDEKDLEKYKTNLIWWLNHPEEQEKIRPEMMKWARTQSWDNVAKQWDESFNE